MRHRRIATATVTAAVAVTALASTPVAASGVRAATPTDHATVAARTVNRSTLVAPGRFGSLPLPASLAGASAAGYLYRNTDCNRWDFFGANYIRVRHGRVVAVAARSMSTKGLTNTDSPAKMRLLYRGAPLTKTIRLDYGPSWAGGWRVYSVKDRRGWLDLYRAFGSVSRENSFLAVRAKSVRSPVDWPTDGC